MKSMCVIGSGGFIGTALRGALHAQGHRLISIGRRAARTEYENETYFAVGERSLTEIAAEVAAQLPDIVIDLAYATVPGTSYSDPVADFSQNLLHVIQHLDFSLAIRAKRYVYVSSGGTVYGEGEGQHQPFAEDSPNFPLSPYGITKLACERYVYLYHRLRDLPALIVRPSNVYGPGQKPFRGQGLIATALGNSWKHVPVQIFGAGDHIRDYLYVDDCCRGIMDVAFAGTPGEIYNLGFGAGHSIAEIMNSVAAAIAVDGLELKREYLRERRFDVHYNVLDVQKIKNLTGWQAQTPLDTGIQQTWQWIKNYLPVNS